MPSSPLETLLQKAEPSFSAKQHASDSLHKRRQKKVVLLIFQPDGVAWPGAGVPPLCLAAMQESQPQRRPGPRWPLTPYADAAALLGARLGELPKGDPATASITSFSCRLIAGLGFTGQHQRGTHSLPAALSLLRAGCAARSAQHRSPTSSSGAMLFLLPSWTGQGGCPLLRTGLCLGMDTCPGTTPQGIHGHHISNLPPTLFLTPTHHNMHTD